MKTFLLLTVGALASGCAQAPDVPFMRICTQQEIISGEGTIEDASTFRLENATVVAASDRILPSGEAAEENGECGPSDKRFELEVQSAAGDRRAWFAVGLASAAGPERPEIQPPSGTVTIDVEVLLGFPTTGRAVVSDPEGPLVIAENTVDFTDHDAGGLTVSAGIETGPTVDGACGINHYHSLEVRGDETIEVETNSTGSVDLNGISISVHHLRTIRNEPGFGPCPPDAGQPDATTWFASRT